MFYLSFDIVLKIFLVVLLPIENTRLRLLHVFPTGTLITIANEAIETLPPVSDKTNKVLSKQLIYSQNVLLIIRPLRISAINSKV